MTAVLITGGTGFIGSRLAFRCLAEGEKVRILSERNTAAERQNCEELQARSVEIIEGSVADAEAAVRAGAGMEVVYHLAAAQHEANVPDQHFYDVNVGGTRNMLEAALEAGVTRFVHGSTIGVYGINKHVPVSDDSPLRPDNIYGVTKLEAEHVVQEYFDRLSCSIVRISETYGPGDRRLLKLFNGIGTGRFVHIGPERNLHHLVYIDDLIDGLRAAAMSPAAVANTFVLAGPEALTTQDMVASICEAMGVRVPRLRLPLSLLIALAVAMETTMGPLGIQPPLHRRRMNFFVKSFRFTCSEARDRLGYCPIVDFAEGARRTLEWYRTMKLL